MVEAEGQPEQRNPIGERRLDGDCDLPLGSARRLEKRVDARHTALRLRIAYREECSRTTVEGCLGRRGDEDEVGLDERLMSPSVSGDRDEVGGLGVVHDDVSAKRPRLWRGQEALELALPETPTESTRDEDRLLLVVDPGLLERRDDRGKSILPRVELSAG
jgi:hypothetical protein